MRAAGRMRFMNSEGDRLAAELLHACNGLGRWGGENVVQASASDGVDGVPPAVRRGPDRGRRGEWQAGRRPHIPCGARPSFEG